MDSAIIRMAVATLTIIGFQYWAVGMINDHLPLLIYAAISIPFWLAEITAVRLAKSGRRLLLVLSFGMYAVWTTGGLLGHGTWLAWLLTPAVFHLHMTDTAESSPRWWLLHPPFIAAAVLDVSGFLPPHSGPFAVALSVAAVVGILFGKIRWVAQSHAVSRIRLAGLVVTAVPVGAWLALRFWEAWQGFGTVLALFSAALWPAYYLYGEIRGEPHAPILRRVLINATYATTVSGLIGMAVIAARLALGGDGHLDAPVATIAAIAFVLAHDRAWLATMMNRHLFGQVIGMEVINLSAALPDMRTDNHGDVLCAVEGILTRLPIQQYTLVWQQGGTVLGEAVDDTAVAPDWVALSLPMRYGRRYVGYLWLGPKDNGDPVYLTEEQMALGALSEMLSALLDAAAQRQEQAKRLVGLRQMYHRYQEMASGLVVHNRLEAIAQLAARVADRLSQRVQVLEGLAYGLPVDDDTMQPILTQLEEIGRIVGGLRAFTSPAHLNARRDELDLRGVVGQVVSEMPELRDIDIRVDMQPVRLCAGRDHMTEMFHQLLLNAVQSGATRITVTGTMVETPVSGTETAVIIITDNGRGIPHHLRRTAMEPFVTSVPADRLGIGLAVVHGITGLYQGVVRLEEGDGGEGTAVIIQIGGK